MHGTDARTSNTQMAVEELRRIRQQLEEEFAPQVYSIVESSGLPIHIHQQKFIVLIFQLEKIEESIDSVDSFGLDYIRRERKIVGDRVRELLMHLRIRQPADMPL